MGCIAETGLVILVVMAGLIFLAIGVTHFQTPAHLTIAEETQNAEDTAAAEAAIQLRNEMRDPQRFQLVLVFVEPDRWSCFVYRAANGFGGMNQDIAVAGDGSVLTADSATEAWNKHCRDHKGRKVTEAVQRLLDRFPAK